MMMDSKFKIRVTNYYMTKKPLRKWKDFLEGKGFETDYKEKIVDGNSCYALMRTLTEREEKELELGLYILRDESLLLPLSEIRKREKNKRRINE